MFEPRSGLTRQEGLLQCKLASDEEVEKNIGTFINTES